MPLAHWAMRRDDVRDNLELARVDPTTYSLEGDRHEALCLLASGQTWIVSASERGTRYDERSFDSEDDACVEFLKRVFRSTDH